MFGSWADTLPQSSLVSGYSGSYAHCFGNTWTHTRWASASRSLSVINTHILKPLGTCIWLVRIHRQRMCKLANSSEPTQTHHASKAWKANEAIASSQVPQQKAPPCTSAQRVVSGCFITSECRQFDRWWFDIETKWICLRGFGQSFHLHLLCFLVCASLFVFTIVVLAISYFIFVNSTLPLPVFVFFPSFGIVFPAHIGFTWALFQEAGWANNYEFVEHASWNRALLLVYLLGPHEYLATHLSICLVSPPVRFSSHVLTHCPVEFIRSLLFPWLSVFLFVGLLLGFPDISLQHLLFTPLCTFKAFSSTYRLQILVQMSTSINPYHLLHPATNLQPVSAKFSFLATQIWLP